MKGLPYVIIIIFSNYVAENSIADSDVEKVEVAVNALPRTEGIGEFAATSQGMLPYNNRKSKLLNLMY